MKKKIFVENEEHLKFFHEEEPKTRREECMMTAGNNDEKREPLNAVFSPVKGDPAPESLISNLSSHDDAIRVRARLSLVGMGRVTVPLLIAALRDGSSLMRWEAAKALGEIEAPESASALVDALEDEDFDVRWLAAEALVRVGIRSLKPLLNALVKREDSQWLREGAHHVIHDLNKGALKKYLEPVHAALNDVTPRTGARLAAADALEELEKSIKL